MKRPDSSERLPQSAPAIPARVHGGPDTLGVPRFDFSTNSNACGPCPQALAAVQQADATRYPDPRYTALRNALAEFHGVQPGRILIAGSASECIFRLTAWVARQGGATVCLPRHAYGDYAQAAQAWGLALTFEPTQASLVWACEPSSPLGQAHTPWPAWLSSCDSSRHTLVLDCAYAPLRLSGAPSLSAAQRDQVWQMFSPNKSLGLTGVRAAYAIAPLGSEVAVQALDALAPSWPLGAHGVALLQAWVQPEVQAWLSDSLYTLRDWKARQIAVLSELGWTCLPSEANFFCARSGDEVTRWAAELAHLRGQGIKLRDTTSFGLPGHARLGVLPPAAQDALLAAWQCRAG
ncbi:MAG: histidinol-phosphate aminotransferase [Comamonadaceae bacterium]|nr:MAG: histidinol-phosphate aminotransferase [Comamonadaceae bacterium]